MAASQEVLKSWGMSAASLRGDGYKPPMKCGSRVVFWLWVGQMCPSSVRAAHPNPSSLVVGCQAKSLVGAATHSSCHCLLWGQFVPRSCRVLGDSSRDRAGELLGTNTASWHSAACLTGLCHDWKGLGTLLLGDKQLLAAQ